MACWYCGTPVGSPTLVRRRLSATDLRVFGKRCGTPFHTLPAVATRADHLGGGNAGQARRMDHVISLLLTISRPSGQGARPASFRCAQAKRKSVMVHVDRRHRSHPVRRRRYARLEDLECGPLTSLPFHVSVTEPSDAISVNNLSAVPQAGRDAVYRQVDALYHSLICIPSAIAPQQFDLHMVQGIEIGKPVAD